MGDRAGLLLNISLVVVMLSIILIMHIEFFQSKESWLTFADIALFFVSFPLLILIHLGWMIYFVKQKYRNLSLAILISALIFSLYFWSIS